MKDIKQYAIKLQSPWDEGYGYNLIPVKGEYQMNGSLAITLFDINNNEEFDVITTNVPFGISDPNRDDLALVDTNNCRWATKWLEDNKLAVPTGNMARSGYCTYPEYKFDLSKTITDEDLKEYYEERSKQMEEKKSNKIRVILKEENKPARVEEIDNDIKFLQGFVGGMIDMTSMPGMNGEVDVICNDEFLYNGSLPNVMVPEYDHIMGGNLIFAGYDPEDGSSISLTDKQIDDVLKYIDKNKVENMDFDMAFCALQAKKMFENVRKDMSEAEM